MSWTNDPHYLLSDSLGYLHIYCNRFLARHTLILKIEAEFAYETSVSTYKTAQYQNPENSNTIFVTTEKIKLLCRQKRQKYNGIMGDNWKETRVTCRERMTDLDTGQQAHVNKPWRNTHVQLYWYPPLPPCMGENYNGVKSLQEKIPAPHIQGVSIVKNAGCFNCEEYWEFQFLCYFPYF